MFQTTNSLTRKSHRDAFVKICLIALVAVFFVTMAMGMGIVPAFAGDPELNETAISSVMNIVIKVVSSAALYIGIVITLWGIFQIILAFRREDSEGISKQITTVIVGAVLTGFGAFANSIYTSLTGTGGTGGGAAS